MNAFITVVVVITFFAQLLFVFNFFVSMFRGRKVTSENPWKATTLEWTTPVHPEHGNWEGPIPEVHRWPYDYKDDGHGNDFIPQNVPLRPGEEEH